MALMMGALYEALNRAGASHEDARKAAEEVAGYENRIAAIEARLGTLTWMVGFNIVLSLATLSALLALAARLTSR